MKAAGGFKLNLKTTGVIEVDAQRLFEVISQMIHDEYGLIPNRLQWAKEGKKVVAIIDSVVDQGAKALGKPKAEPKETTKYQGKAHKWEGFYASVGEILDEQRKRKRSFISYEDLLAELHDMEDNRGNKLFVKGGEKLPMAVLRHRLAPSQIIRQSKGQPNLKGVENDKKNKGLKFS